MTHRADRYTFTRPGPHPCPDAYPTSPHDLIKDRDENGEPIPNRWVCPHDLSQERAEAHSARIAAEEAAERAAAQQERAEKIAAEALAELGAPDPNSTERATLTWWGIHDQLVAAALRGMTETENAR
jgi:hypothetical protein